MTLPNANYRQSTKAQVFCLAVILMLGSVIPVWSNDGSSYLGQLQQLVRLAENSRNKAQVFDQLEQLQKSAPNDAMLAYVHALVLRDHRNKDSLRQLQTVTELKPWHLNASKAQVWLSVHLNKDLDGALTILDRFSTKLVDIDSGSTEAVLKSQDFTIFMGRLFGYLGAQPESYDSVKVNLVGDRIFGRLTPKQQSLFNNARQEVVLQYRDLMDVVGQSRESAYRLGEASRSGELERIQQDREFARAKLAELTQQRVEVMKIHSNERNVIAGTRSRELDRTASYFSREYRADLKRNPYWTRSPNASANAPFQQAYGTRGQAGSSTGSAYRNEYRRETGLGDNHYRNTNDREEKELDRLDDEIKNLQIKIRGLSRDEEKLNRKSNVGNNRTVRRHLRKATSLATYLEFPVDADAEIQQVLGLASK